MSSRIFYNSQSEAIQLGHRAGIGGEGTVYEIQGQSDLVAKIYHEPPPPEKAEKLITLSCLGTDRLFNLSAWPVDVVRDQALRTDGSAGGGIVGFLMKKIGEAEEVHTLHSPKSRLRKFPEASWAFLIYVAANIARAVSVIHEHGYVVGDVNPKNILVTRKATVYLLDCDSFQISADGKTYRCEGGFPEYTPPELQGLVFKDVNRHPGHDSFGLAVVVFQLLFLGRHPFSGRFSGSGEMPLERAIREHRFAFGSGAESRQMQPPPGTLSLDALPASITELFRRAFLSPHRPLARDWIEPLESLAKSLKKCRLHTGHHFFQELADCPWCEIELRARIRLFNFGVTAPNQSRNHFRLDEIWKEIETIAAPPISQAVAPMTGRNLLPLVKISEQAAPFVKAQRERLYWSLCFSGIAGFLCGYIGGFALGSLLLAGAAFLTRKIVGAAPKQPAQLPSLLHPQTANAENPFVQQIEAAKERAEEELRQLEERWQKEAGDERFLAGLGNLQSQKETYLNLARIRERKLKQLESNARARQVEEFLEQFEIADANISGVNLATQILLRSHGIETAADLTKPKLEQIRRIDEIGAKRLREWRRELGHKFVFDPAKRVPAQARVSVEREMDELRLRLEHEMSSGAYYLRRIKQDVEDNQRKLHPLMAAARKSLAQAERDYEAVTKPVSARLAIVALIIVFVVGLSLNDKAFNDSFGHGGHTDLFSGEFSDDYVEAPQPQPAVEVRADASPKDQEKALELYSRGMDFMKKNEFEEAAGSFQHAIALDPQLNYAHQELGYALYRLWRYEDSILASTKALALNGKPGKFFEPHYHIGLAHIAQNEWDSAKDDLLTAISFIQSGTGWGEKQIHAYYLLGEVLMRLNDIHPAIESLENSLRSGNGKTIQHFELGNLYLRVGRNEAAREQYKQLKKRDKALAAALKKLMVRHGVR